MATADYLQLRDDLRRAYDGAADRRDRRHKQPWKLGLPAESFDAVHAMNCLLHVPNAELPAVLRSIARALRPGGLFFLGVYGVSEMTQYRFQSLTLRRPA